MDFRIEIEKSICIYKWGKRQVELNFFDHGADNIDVLAHWVSVAFLQRLDRINSARKRQKPDEQAHRRLQRLDPTNSVPLASQEKVERRSYQPTICQNFIRQ
jgi:hypothetical protein